MSKSVEDFITRPQKPETKNLNAKIPAELFMALKKHVKSRKLKLRSYIEAMIRKTLSEEK